MDTSKLQDKYLQLLTDNNKVFIITKNDCPLCIKLKDLFDLIDIEYTTYLYDETQDEKQDQSQDVYPFKQIIKNDTRGKYFPFCYINSVYVGGYNEIHQNLMTGKLKDQLNEIGLDYEEDF